MARDTARVRDLPRLGTARAWKQANQDLWSVLFLTTPGSASNPVKKCERKKAEDGTGDGYPAWETLNEKYSIHIKEARKACHEKLVNTKMKPGQDFDDFFFVLNGGCDLLEKMGQTVHDECYEDIILQALPAEYGTKR